MAEMSAPAPSPLADLDVLYTEHAPFLGRTLERLTGPGPHVERRGRKNRRVALAMGSLLVPVAVMASVLGVWRLAADLKIAGDFAIANGLFSHWQVWIASAVVRSPIPASTLSSKKRMPPRWSRFAR